MTVVVARARAVPRPLSRRGGLRRARRRARLLRGLRLGRADDPAAADVGAHPLAPLEAADPVPRTALPCRHVRRARERPLRPPAGRRGIRDPRVRCRHARGHGRDRDGARCPRRRVVRGALGRRARRGASGARRRRRVHRVGRPAGAAAARTHRLSLPRAARYRRRVGEVQHAPLAAGLSGLPRVLHREVLHGAALDEADRGRHRLGARDDPRCARGPRRRHRPADRRRLQGALRARSLSGARHPRRRGRAPLARARRGARRGDGRAARHAPGLRTLSAGAGSGGGQPALQEFVERLP